MKITVKSTPKNWEEEREGKRDYTTRGLDGKDVLEIVNRETGEVFIRKITSIAKWGKEIIISFEKKESKVGEK